MTAEKHAAVEAPAPKIAKSDGHRAKAIRHISWAAAAGIAVSAVAIGLLGGHSAAETEGLVPAAAEGTPVAGRQVKDESIAASVLRVPRVDQNPKTSVDKALAAAAILPFEVADAQSVTATFAIQERRVKSGNDRNSEPAIVTRPVWSLRFKNAPAASVGEKGVAPDARCDYVLLVSADDASPLLGSEECTPEQLTRLRPGVAGGK